MKAFYNVIFDLAKKQVVSGGVQAYHLLYGYAKIILMDKFVVQTMAGVNEEECEKQRNELVSVFEKKNLDWTLIQEGMPLLLLMKQCLKAKVDMERYEVPDNPSDPNLAKRMLEQLLEEDIPELKVFSKGNNLDHIFQLIEGAEAQNKEQEKKREETKREESKQEEERDKRRLSEVLC